MTVEEILPRLEALEKQLATIPSLSQDADEVAKTKQRIAELLTATEQAQRKADDEALRAYSAKQLCEEHAKSTGTIRGQVEVEFQAINATKTKCEDAERAIGAGRVAADEAVSHISSSRDALQQAQSWVAQNLPQIDAQGKAIAATKSSVDGLLTEANDAVAQVKSALETAARTRDQIISNLDPVTNARLSVDGHATKASEAKVAAEAASSTVAEKLREIEAVLTELMERHSEIAQFKSALEELQKQNRELSAKAEGLLPHCHGTVKTGQLGSIQNQPL